MFKQDQVKHILVRHEQAAVHEIGRASCRERVS
jgi:thiamine pyrophosphate-dependent acetolactate synthase large subunit-like protein